MFNKIAKILLILALLFAPAAHADESVWVLPEGAEEVPRGNSASLKKGEKAPFDGMLLDDVALARILMETEFLEESFQIKIDSLKERHKLELVKVREQRELELDILHERMKIEREARAKEIDELYNALEDSQDDYDMWWFLGGFAGGILLTTGIAAVIVYVQ